MTTTDNLQCTLTGIDHLDDVVDALNPHKALIVADASFTSLSIRGRVESIRVPCVFFTGFGSNPLYEDVCNGVDLFRKEGCDVIVAVGGGSCIDVAKCIKLFCKMSPNQLYLQQDYTDTQIPLIAIPTTAGTGSEATCFAVIYYQGMKQSVTHPSIIPSYAILEPSVLASLPLYQKKCTALDALCQGIESWWSIHSTEQSRFFSSCAVRTLVDNIEPYIFDKSTVAASRVMDAANKAGQAINITQTTAPHAFSYKLTSLYRLPHGHAVAVCLPWIWQYMIEKPSLCIDARGVEWLNDVFSQIADAMHCANATEAVGAFRALLARLGIDSPHAEERDSELSILVQSVNSTRLKNNPVSLNEESIRLLYNSILL